MKSTNKQAQSTSLMNVDVPDNSNSGNNEEMVYKEPIPGTPFWIISEDKKAYYLVMGQHRLSEPKESAEAIYQYIETDGWNITGMMIMALLEIRTQKDNWNKIEQELNKMRENQEHIQQYGTLKQ